MKQLNYSGNIIEKIAKGYAEADDDAPYIKDSDLHNMRQLINLQFAHLSQKVYFDFVDKDPYTYTKIDELDFDWRRGIIKVNTSGNDSMVWGKVYNLQFRAIHDYIHCLHRLDFNFYSEIEAFKKQYEFSLKDEFTTHFPYMDWDLYKNVIRSEIVYQAAVKEHFQQFHIDQKIVLADL